MTRRILLRHTKQTSTILTIGILLFFVSLQTVQANTERLEKLQAELTRHYDTGNYKEAIPYAADILELKIKIHGTDHLEVAKTINKIGEIHFKDNNYSDAEIYFLRALNLFKKILGTNHSHVASTLHSLGDVYRKTGVFSRAEQFYRVAIRIREDTLGSDHQSVASTLNNLGELYKQNKMYAQAEPLYQRSLEIFESVLEPGHAHIGIAVHNLADLYRIQESYEKALPLYQRLLTLTEESHPSDDPKVVALKSIVTELKKSTADVAKLEPETQEPPVVENDMSGESKEGTDVLSRSAPVDSGAVATEDPVVPETSAPEPAVEEAAEETVEDTVQAGQNEEKAAAARPDNEAGEFDAFSPSPDSFGEATLTSNVPLNAFSGIGMNMENTNDDIQEETLTAENPETDIQP